jgi:DNA-directed RNA polymerase specialized sigma24 family protein
MQNPEYSLYWYLEQAKAVIGKWGQSWMINDHDNVGVVAYYMMVADQTYDPSRGAKQSTWRITRARYALKNIISNRAKKKEVSLNAIMGNSGSNKEQEFIHIVASKPSGTEIDVENIISNSSLSEKQESYIRKYMGGKNMVNIAEEEGICKQAVSYTIGKAVEKMQRRMKRE